MKIPRRTAHFGAGPSSGCYAEVAGPASNAVLAAMGSDLMTLTLDPSTAPMLAAGKCPDGRDLCLGNQVGDTGVYEYRCCDPGERCVPGADGHPKCVPSAELVGLAAGANKQGSSLPPEIAKYIMSLR